MIVLAFETSAQDVSLALMCGAEVQSETLYARPGQPAGDGLLVAARRLLAAAGVTMQALDGIAFGAGPGAFTGLRLGCAAAQGLGVALDRPLVAVGSLDALAASEPEGEVLCALDARLGELYVAAFRVSPAAAPQALSPILCLPAVDLPALGLAQWIGLGSGFAVAGDALLSRVGGTAQRIDSQRLPQATTVARLAALELAAGRGIDPADAAPLYVRNKVAKTVAERLAEGLKA